jgi:hypothetical protein
MDPPRARKSIGWLGPGRGAEDDTVELRQTVSARMTVQVTAV